MGGRLANRHVHFARAAKRDLKKLDRQSQRTLVTAIEGLKDDPRPPGVEKLSGHPDFYRIRVGDYRIVYAIPNAELIVVCIIKDRKNSYKGLDHLGAKLTHALEELTRDQLERSWAVKLT